MSFAGAVNAFLCCNLASLARRKGINGQPFQLEKVGYYKVIMIVEIQIVFGGFQPECKELLKPYLFARPNPICAIISWIISWTISWQIIPYKTERWL